jgi:hypothetical protein
VRRFRQRAKRDQRQQCEEAKKSFHNEKSGFTEQNKCKRLQIQGFCQYERIHSQATPLSKPIDYRAISALSIAEFRFRS